MLLDAWAETLSYPDLRQRMKESYFDARYGDKPSEEKYPPNKPLFGEGSKLEPIYGQRADLVLIEAKGSGIAAIADLGRMGIPIRAYDPTRKGDKVQRLHAVSHLVCNKRCYVIESSQVAGEPVSWAQDFLEEVCTFPNSLNDDYTDTLSQVLSLLRDQAFLSIDPPPDEDDFEDADEELMQRVANPYAA
jgi:predicted phage terminase large subunit-like protein